MEYIAASRDKQHVHRSGPIRDLLGTSERSLNTSDAALAAISLDVTFTIDELVVISNDVAYAPTRSNGTRRVSAGAREARRHSR